MKLVPVGLSRPVKKLLKPRVPDLERLADIGDLAKEGATTSDSEAEFLSMPENRISMPAHANDPKFRKSAVRCARRFLL